MIDSIECESACPLRITLDTAEAAAEEEEESPP
jgi:hypothetical protein